MHLITSAQKYISIFISHSAPDNAEAQQYGDLLSGAGFSVFQYADSLMPGGAIGEEVRDKIQKCHFFLLLVSDYSLASEWVQRELGLAVALRHRNGKARPIIIPIYTREAVWRRTHRRPTAFPTRDFATGEQGESFDLTVRGIDKYENPIADSDERLLEFLKPDMLVTRVDFDDVATFEDTGVFDLYEALFPADERDDPEDIMGWTLNGDIGEERVVHLTENTTIRQRLDSRYFILRLASRAIGLGFFTYDFSTKLIYGNYIGVHAGWRGGDIASAFFKEILHALKDLFPEYLGMVFEVERCSKRRVEEIISGLEKPDAKDFQTEADRAEIRKFLRVSWYQKLDCFFFFDDGAQEPVVCTGPSIAAQGTPESWSGGENRFWIMWYGRPDMPLDLTQVTQTWINAVRSIYIEVLAKSIALSYPDKALAYWRYANHVVDTTLAQASGKKITLSKFLYRQDASNLLRRWVKLRRELPI